MATSIATVRITLTEGGNKLVRCEAAGCQFSQIRPAWDADLAARLHQQSHVHRDPRSEID